MELDGISDQRLLLSVEEAHRQLNIGRTMFLAEIYSGRIRSIKVGSRRLIPTSALVEYIDDKLSQHSPLAG